MPFLFNLWIACAFLRLSAAEDSHCNVTQDAGRTIYTISLSLKFNQMKCRYSWSNATDYTLANHLDRTDDLVVTKNDTTLTTYKCMGEVKYRRDCIAEKMSYAVICTTNCSRPTWPGLPLYETHHHLIIEAVLISLVLVLVVVVVVVYRKSRCRTSRKPAEENPDPSTLL